MRLASTHARKALRGARPGESLTKAAKRLHLEAGWSESLYNRDRKGVVPPHHPNSIIEEKSGSPPQGGAFLRGWSRAIAVVDRHVGKCRRCPKTEGGCRKMRKLWVAETKAREDYLAAGGRLPTN